MFFETLLFTTKLEEKKTNFGFVDFVGSLDGSKAIVVLLFWPGDILRYVIVNYLG